jgi:hypothetical protein
MILKLKGMDSPLEISLRHELIHIYESILHLKWGTLTKNLVLDHE